MKKILFLTLGILFINVAFSQTGKKPLFKNSYYGFATGFYPTGQSPAEVKAGDLDNDGDSDLVVAQQNFSNGFVVLINQGKGLYAAPVKYNSAKAALNIVIADLNNDGKKDVALTNSGKNFDGKSISVYFNTGKGKFGVPVNYNVGAYPTGISAADLDNDGDNDLAVANNLADSNHSVSVLINKGNGTFNAAVNFNAGNKALRIESAKINNDNLPDLIVGNNTQNITILFNGGNNNFSSKQILNVIYTFPVEDASATVKSADFDNDGDNDIIFSSAYTYHSLNEIALFTNKGNGSFNAPKFLQLNAFAGTAVDLDTGDFNNDGRTDILAANFSGRTGDGYEVILNQGNNNFSIPDIKPAGQSTYFVAAADVDNDNKMDVITSDFYSIQVTIHKNAGNAVFPLPPFFTTNNSTAGSLDAADIDGDGDLDLLTSASGIAAVGVTVTVLKNNGNGSFTPGIAYSIRGGGVQAKFRDLNGDKKPDLIFATAISTPPYDFHTAINNGNGRFGPRQTWSMNSCGWSDIDAVDVDNDGDNDAVIIEWLGCPNVPNSSRRLFISKNNGHGSFTAPVIILINPSPGCIATGDLNKDGKIDLVTGQSLSIDVHLNNGTNSLFNAPVTYATSESPYDILVTDLNNDGNPDIAACTEFNHEGMSVLLGNGNGTFQPAQNYNGAYSPDLRNESGITSGDVDGDGDMDILVGNYASNDVSLYLNNGNGSFKFTARTGMYYGVESPVYADFNGDGKKDIVAIVGVPPGGLQSQIAIIKGNVFNETITPGSFSHKETTITNDIAANGISVINNPFTNYIDVKFLSAPHDKVKFILYDVTGLPVFTKENNISQSLYRLNVDNEITKSGVYFLSAEMNGNKYRVTVTRR
ncbi:MAG TPA: VCBS repeat-containing protein [Parafilimonas sp.]|nr:VCBS repeat-containing protein [Parafilimonas sp.]